MSKEPTLHEMKISHLQRMGFIGIVNHTKPPRPAGNPGKGSVC